LDNATALGQAAPLTDMLLKQVDVPERTKFCNAMLKIPDGDFALEMTEFTNMQVRPGKPRAYDPGAALLILTVMDVDAALAIAKKAGAEVVTSGGGPLGIRPNSTTRTVFVKDPDSFYVEFVQSSTLPATTAPASSNVIAARFGRWWRTPKRRLSYDQFGLETKVNAW
jgi:hypothetical protein